MCVKTLPNVELLAQSFHCIVTILFYFFNQEKERINLSYLNSTSFFLSTFLLFFLIANHDFSKSPASSPEFPLVYQSDEEQERLMGLYQDLHSCLHHPTRPLRSFYRCGETENLLAWVSWVGCGEMR